MDNEEKMRITIDEARKSLVNKEFPVGAVIFLGDEIIGRAHSSGESKLELLPHAEIAALFEADKLHHLPPERKKMQLFTTLEPCMMCLGAAMSFYIGEIYYALEAPIDGAVDFAVRFWRENRKEIPSYTLPAIHSGLMRSESQDLLREYINVVPNGPLVEFCKTLIAL
ncbi:MAG: nucleoside deaminase [Dehalococcoidales bacterium]|nr:MAG: nucleoside deaminase [Dehalococcoidales bacterium]